MTWDPKTSRGNEQDKIAAIAVPHLQGRALDLGCGMRKVWPSLIGVDSGGTFGAHTAADVHANIADLSMFADGSMDAVFSSHALEDFDREKVPAVLAEWARVLKVGGKLVLYVPSANLYPKCGEPGANPHHRWDIYPGDIEAMLKDMVTDEETAQSAPDTSQNIGWELLESEERGEDDEYSLYIVARKTESGWTENVWQRNPDGAKRCLVIRYGGIGDMIMTASILPHLKAQGFNITMNCRADTAQILRHDPNIDEWIEQATDFVPNVQLGPYWRSLGKRYDKVVNLCESIEGALLLLADRLQSQYPDDCRRKIAGTVNYVERTHDIAGVPHDYAPRFYATPFEHNWATGEKFKRAGPVVLWTLNGSSPHKVWPWTHVVAAWLAKRTPAHIYLAADAGIGRILQDAIVEKLREDGADLSRIYAVAGKWTVRQTLAFAQVADCVVGPETGVLNAVSMDPVPKVIMLSHSSHANLTRDWINAEVLIPDTERAPCYPCHKLHHGWETCHQHPDTNAALCASAISPEQVFEAVAMSLGARKAA